MGAAFLQKELPLEPLAASPPELLSNVTSSIAVSGRQTLTVVFSRPVIALGSDFGVGPQLPPSMLPFTLSCNLPGLTRWVTTSIARFDPGVDWPTDLDCAFQWNTRLQAFDGAPLKLGGAPRSVKLTSSPLQITLADVTSAAANKATQNYWNTFRAMPDDNIPEVPADGNITLTFSYPVQFSVLQSSLQIVSCCSSNAAAGRKLTVLPCPQPSWAPLFTYASTMAAPPTSPAAQNATCAVVRISPALDPQQGAIIRLPKGARYSSLSGPTSNYTDVYVFGLRRFRIPLRQNFQQLANASDVLGDRNNAIGYRRLGMWLPHGLADGTQLAALLRLISICRYADPYNWFTPCTKLDTSAWTLTRPSLGQLVLTVPQLQPRQHYRINVAASAAISDAFGLKLQASEAFFFTSSVYPAFQGPMLASGSSVVLMEAGGSKAPPLPWPLVSVGQAPPGDTDATLSSASVWALPSGAALAKAAAAMSQGDNAYTSDLGRPAASIQRSPSANGVATFTSLQLSGAQGGQLVGSCCYQGSDSNGAKLPAYLGNRAVVVTSDLQLVAVVGVPLVTAWVTSARGTPSPIQGAKVTLYLKSWGEDATPGPSCTTGPDGACVIDPSGPLASSYYYLSLLVEAAGHGPLLMPNLGYPSLPSSRPNYTAALVLDHELVRPGEKVHVTGYVLRPNGASLGLPTGVSKAALLVTPNPGNPSGDPLSVPVTLDAKYGSLHTAITFPANAEMQSYTIALQLTPTGGEPATLDNTASVTVSDPRPPTASLNLTAPPWAPPRSSVPLTLTASSYIGASVSGALITYTWYTPRASGSGNISTNASGIAIVQIPLGALPVANASSEGDVLSVTAVWIGPTREQIVETAVVKLQGGPVRLDLARSPATDLPGVPFGLSVAAWSNIDDTYVPGVAVDVTLVANASGPGGAAAALAACSAADKAALAAQSCRLVSGVVDLPECQLKLPCQGDFKLRACAKTFGNGTAVPGTPCVEVVLGHNASIWSNYTWSSQPAPTLLPDKVNYTLGDKATLAFNNPYAGAASGLLVWGSGSKRLALPTLPPGPNKVTIGPLGAECASGCDVQLLLSVARPEPGSAAASAAAARLPKLPTSLLFDPLAPFTATASALLRVPAANLLNVTISIDAYGRTADNVSVVPPRGSALISVTVTDPVRGALVPGAEVTLMAVDRAVLDLLPYDLQDVPSQLALRGPCCTSTSDLNGLRALRSAINATFATLNRRLNQLDPWLPVITTVTPNSPYGALNLAEPSPVDTPDAAYLAGYVAPVTYTPFWGWGITQRYPGGSGSGDASAALRLQGNFEATPLFKVLTTSADGTATATFTAPDNLGEFVVRAYVAAPRTTGVPSATTAVSYGSNETALIVRTPLSLTGSLPRIVRVGDEFEAGIILTAAGTTTSLSATVTARIYPANTTGAPLGVSATPLSLQPRGPVSYDASVSAAQQAREVRFKLRATAIGTANLTFVVTLENGDVADALQLDVPVLGRQLPVTVATSFALLASEGGSREEGLQLPLALNGSGSLNLTAGVGHLPAVQGLYESLVSANKYYTSASAPQSVGLSLLPADLGRYARAANASAPGAGPLLTAAQRNASLAAINDTVSKLTDSQLGLLWSDPSAPYGGGRPADADVTLNSWAAWLVGQVKAPGGDKAFAGAWAGLTKVAPTWKKAAAKQLTDDAVESRSSQQSAYSDLSTLSWARLALGPAWVPDASAGPQVAADLSMARLRSGLANLTSGDQARVALALLDGGADRADPTVKAAVAAQLRSLRVAGRSAYVAYGPGSSSASSLGDQALSLMLLTRAGEQARNPLVQKLAAGVAGGAPTSPLAPLCSGVGGWDAALSGAALAAYDAAQGSTQPDADLAALAQPAGMPSGSGKLLLAAKFTADNAGKLASSATPWSGVPRNSSLVFATKGRGEVSVAAVLDFEPAQVLPYASYRGLWVDRVVRTAAGASSATVPLADLASVVVQVTTPDDLSNVVVQVLMPAGLEPLDPNIFPDPEPYCGWSGGNGWWSPCPSQQTRPDAVTYTFAFMPAGTHNLRVRAVAATPGVFLLPPVKAYVVQQPEVMGLSAGSSLTVCAPPPLPGAAPAIGADAPACPPGGATPRPAAAPAQSCPEDCNDNGACNLSKGVCLCNSGFTGSSCATFVGASQS